MHIPSRKFPLSVIAAVLSVITLLVFHFPFFRYVLENTERDFNGTLIFIGLGIIMLACNYFGFYLVLWLGRTAGRIVSFLAFIGNATALYFINTYDVIIDDTMMGNVFNTNTAEATGFWSLGALLYLLFAGVLPGLIALFAKIGFGSFKRFLANIGISLGVVAVVAFGNMSNWMWIDKNAPVMGSLILPWSYVVNTFRYHNGQKELNRKETPLPDAKISDDTKSVAVVIIGESSRRDHFSIYGYERETNPLTSKIQGIKAYKARSNATYTTAGVKAILSYRNSGELYEILPNYLYRNGVNVIWRTSNWGQPPLHIENFSNEEDLASKYGSNPAYDDILLKGLKEEILAGDKSKTIVFLHTSISHGPSYARKYPPEYEKWTPVPTTVEMSKCPSDQLCNAYDNGILYTDHFIAETVAMLKELEDRKSAVIFVSDHGESLGENGLYMHGVPISIAPPEQYEIPFLVWSSDDETKYRDIEEVTQFHVFHSVLRFLGIDSPVYDGNLDIFE